MNLFFPLKYNVSQRSDIDVETYGDPSRDWKTDFYYVGQLPPASVSCLLHAIHVLHVPCYRGLKSLLRLQTASNLFHLVNDSAFASDDREHSYEGRSGGLSIVVQL